MKTLLKSLDPLTYIKKRLSTLKYETPEVRVKRYEELLNIWPEHSNIIIEHRDSIDI